MAIKKWLCVAVIISVGLLAGCEATARSDRAEQLWQTTASYERIMASPSAGSPIVPRQWGESEATYAPCVVTHFGSYFDDPIAIDGDGNTTYGWTCFDGLAIVYCPCRFLVNTVAVPVSMIKEPPGVLTTRDLDIPLEATLPTTQPVED